MAKQAMVESVKSCEDVCPSSSEVVDTTALASKHSSSAESSVTRISLPLLSGSVEAQYRAQRRVEATAVVWNCDKLKCDEPLQLRLPMLNTQRTTGTTDCNHSSAVQLTDSYKQTCSTGKQNAFSSLIAAYGDDTER